MACVRKTLTTLFAVLLAVTTLTVAPVKVAAEDEKTVYRNNGFTFEKLSHSESGTEMPDGVVDYIDGKVVPHVNGTENKGDTVQSYTYCSAAAGDWVYINTMYGALSAHNTAGGGFKAIAEQIGLDVSDEFGGKVVDAVFNGKLNRGAEADGSYEGSVLFKFNIKTGETVVLMSRDMYEEDVFENGTNGCAGVPIFRSTVTIDGDIYFVGLVSRFPQQMIGAYRAGYVARETLDTYLNGLIMIQTGAPELYKVTPSYDSSREKVTLVKSFVTDADLANMSASMEDMKIYGRNAMNKSVFTSTRAIGEYKGSLVIAGLEVNEGETWNKADPDAYAPCGAVLYISSNPSDPDSYIKIADQESMFNYPAIWRDGASGGGGVYQVLEYNDALYVAIVTGTADTKDPNNGQFRPYAVIKGTPNNPADYSKGFEWKSVIGDLEKGSKYEYGIDPARRAANAVTMQVYGGYLYLGDYNDVNGSLNSFLNMHLEELYYNLRDSINLYRLNENDEVEMIVGDPTPMFLNGSTTGWGSGYESNHMMQYTWMTTEFDGKMYLSSMDETSLTHLLAQFVNGELVSMSKEEWETQIEYIMDLIEDLTAKKPAEAPAEEDADQTEALAAETVESAETLEPAEVLESEETETAAEIQESETELVALAEESEEADPLKDMLNDLNSSIAELKDLLGSNDHKRFITLFKDTVKAFDIIADDIPDTLREGYLTLIGSIDSEQMKYLQGIMEYLELSVAGFDLYVLDQDEKGNVDITTATLNGFNDKYNHGLRIFQEVNGELVIGTANPFYGCQIWKMTDTPFVADVDDAKEALNKAESSASDLAINAMINGQSAVSIDAAIAAANEASAEAFLKAAELTANAADKRTDDMSKDAIADKETAVDAANVAEEKLNGVRLTDSETEAISLASDAYNAKLTAESAAIDAEHAYNAAKAEYEIAKARIEAQLAAGLIDAKQAEAAAKAAQDKADAYYDAKLAAKSEADRALVAAATALVEAADKLDDAFHSLSAKAKAVKEEFGDTVPAYVALQAAKTVVNVAQLTVSAYEAEIKTLDALIGQLDKAIADANAKITDLEEAIDAEEKELATNKEVIEEAKKAIEIAENAKANAEKIKEQKEKTYYMEMLAYQQNITNGTYNNDDVTGLTEIIIAQTDFFSTIDPEFGFGASSINWVKDGDEIDDEHTVELSENQLVFSVVTNDGTVYYEAIVNDGKVEYYKTSLSRKSADYGDALSASGAGYAAVMDGVEYPLSLEETSDGCGGTSEKLIYKIGSETYVADENTVIIELGKMVFVEGEMPESTNSNSINTIVNKYESADYDQAISANLKTINDTQKKVNANNRKLSYWSEQLEAVASVNDVLQDAYDASVSRKETAENKLHGDKLQQAVTALINAGIIDEAGPIVNKLINGNLFEKIGAVLELYNLVNNSDMSDDIKALVNETIDAIVSGNGSSVSDFLKIAGIINKVQNGSLEAEDIRAVLEMIQSSEFSLSAELRLAIVKSFAKIVEDNYNKEAAELSAAVDELKGSLNELGAAGSAYVQAVKNLADAVANDAKANLLKAEAKRLKIKADNATRDAITARIEYEALLKEFGPNEENVKNAKDAMDDAKAKADEANRNYQISQKIADVVFSSDLRLSMVTSNEIFFEGKDANKRYDLIVKIFEDQAKAAKDVGETLTDSKFYVDAYIVEDGERLASLVLDKPVTVSIDVPASLANKPLTNGNNARRYNVYCYHNGVRVNVASRLGAAGGRLEFAADKFSTYVIEAVDYVKTEPVPYRPVVNTSTK